MKKIQLILLFVFGISCFACGLNELQTTSGLSEKQTTLVNEALKALKKIDAATQVGVDRFSYRQLLIEAKAEVNEAKENLPKGELQDHLFLAMFWYEHADFQWESLGKYSGEAVKDAWQKASKELKEASELIK